MPNEQQPGPGQTQRPHGRILPSAGERGVMASAGRPHRPDGHMAVRARRGVLRDGGGVHVYDGDGDAGPERDQRIGADRPGGGSEFAWVLVLWQCAAEWG